MLPGVTVWLTGCSVMLGATTAGGVADPTTRVAIADVLAP